MRSTAQIYVEMRMDNRHADAQLEDATREADRLRTEIATLSAELNSAWKHAQLMTTDRNLWRANSDTANAALRAGMANRAEENARHSQAYVNVDDGYPWLTCGECDGLLHCIDGGDRLDTLTQAVNSHECATEQSAEAA